MAYKQDKGNKRKASKAGGIMASELRILLWSDQATARECLNRWQFILFKQAQRAIYLIFISRLKRFSNHLKESKDCFVERGDKEYLKKEFLKLESFLFSDSDILRKKKGYEEHINNRWVQKVFSRSKKLKDKVKDVSLKRALGGNTVLSFLNGIGIFVEWELNG